MIRHRFLGTRPAPQLDFHPFHGWRVGEAPHPGPPGQSHRALSQEALIRESVCMICLAEMTASPQASGQGRGPEAVAQIPCGHPFHADCLRRWTSRTPGCPTCRLPIDWLVHGEGSDPAFSPWATLQAVWLELAGLRQPHYGTQRPATAPTDHGSYWRPPSSDATHSGRPRWPRKWARILWNIRVRAYHLGIPPQ